MATYDFRSSIGTTIAFSTSDILSFEYDRASELNFQQSGSDIIVSISGSSVRLANISFSSLKNSNFIFKNGDLVRFDTSASETLSGGTGYDYLDITKGGSDTVSAGDGDDLIVVGSSLNAADRIAGGAGLDTLTLSGTYGSTVVLDSSTITGIENITAGAGSQIRLQIDNNTAASATNGLLSYDASAQSQSDVTIFDGSRVTTSSLVIRTGGGADTLTGGGQADSLSGGDGNDIISGGAGNDSIAGGLGQDTLTGGAGIDTYSFGFGIPRSESAPNTADVITDFEGRGTAGGDLISLPSFNNNLPLAFNIEALDFNFTGYGTSGSQAGAKAGDGFVDVFWRYNASAARNEIWVDANDDGQFSEVDILIHLPKTSDGATTITFGDFVNNFPVIRLTENADTFTGTATSETIYGVGGADTISGLGGNDELYGGAGNDRLDGGAGSDQLSGGTDNDTLLGGDGTDYLYGGVGADTLSGGNDADYLYADYDPQTGGGDAIGTVNVLNGDGGNDQLYGGAGNDQLNGGADDDYLSASSGQDTLSGGDGADILYGGSDNDTLSGGAGIDTLRGDGGKDTLTGGSEADTFAWYASDATFAGADQVTDFSRSEGDKLDITGIATSYKPLVFRGDLLAANASFKGAGGDALPGSDLGDGFTQVWSARLGSGTTAKTLLIADMNQNNQLDSDDFVVEFTGTTAPTLLSESDFTAGTFQVKVGTVGNDTLTGTADGDRIYGVAGADTISGLGGNDELYGGAGNDRLDGGAGSDQLAGGVDNDTLLGGDGTDYLYGGVGADTLSGGNEADYLYAEYDPLTGGGDAVGTVNVLNGDGGNDYLYGGIGNDQLNGGLDADYLYGNNGQDSLDGGAGVDYLSGGSGADIFAFSASLLASNADRIDDFSAVDDTIQLEASVFTALSTGALSASAFKDLSTGSKDSDDRILYDSRTGALSYDADGSGTAFTAIQFATLDNKATISAADFVVVDSSVVVGGTFTGTSGADNLIGTNGNDTINGLAGADRMTGLRGDDIFIVDNAGDVVVEDTNGGTDTVQTSLASYILGSNVENLTYTGSSGFTGTGNDQNNVIRGGAGADRLDGRAGADTLIGGAGNDVYNVDNLSDVVSEETALGSGVDAGGTDTVNSSVSYTLGSLFENLTLTGSAIIDGTGNGLNNTLVGNSAANILSGGGGNDSLNGGLGADTLLGGAGNDVYTVDNTGDVLSEETALGSGVDAGGTDTVNSSVTFILGNFFENLTLTGSATIDGTGNGSNNSLVGNSAANILSGGDGNDSLNGGLGADTLLGGAGNDTYTVDNTGDVVSEETALGSGIDAGGTDLVNSAVTFALSGFIENLTLTGSATIDGAGNSLNNTLNGNTANNVLSGGDGNDILNGAVGDDTLIGGAGNDSLIGGLGADTHLGGAGNDTYTIDNLGDVVSEETALGSGIDAGGTDFVSSAVTFTLSSFVENLTLTGSATIDGTGNELNNALVGNSAANILSGGGGNDTLNGGLGADTLLGGAGNDSYTVDNTGDVVSEETALGSGVDAGGTDLVNSAVTFALSGFIENLTLTGSAAIDGTGNGLNNALNGNTANNVLSGGDGNDILNGAAGNDTLLGGSGNDSLIGGLGADTHLGGAGNDVYTVDNTGDIVSEETALGSGVDAGGTDLVNSAVTFTLSNFVENLTLTGSTIIDGTGNSLNNTLVGNAAANTLSGGAGNDSLNGGAGNDILIGGAGTDTLTGGLGADQFFFASPGGGTDLILDFTRSQGDKIVVAATGFSGLTAGTTLPSDWLVNGTAATADHGQFIYNSTSKQLSWDDDGTGSAAAQVLATFSANIGPMSTSDLLIA